LSGGVDGAPLIVGGARFGAAVEPSLDAVEVCFSIFIISLYYYCLILLFNDHNFNFDYCFENKKN
jgi:hypothetical protein